MTDNEKRAHDLTFLYLKDYIADKGAQGALKSWNGEREITAPPIDLLDAYADLYKQFLAGIKKRFPET